MICFPVLFCFLCVISMSAAFHKWLHPEPLSLSEQVGALSMSCSRALCQHTHRDRLAIWSRVRFPVGVVKPVEWWRVKKEKEKKYPTVFCPFTSLDSQVDTGEVMNSPHLMSPMFFLHHLYCRQLANSDRQIMLSLKWPGKQEHTGNNRLHW